MKKHFLPLLLVFVAACATAPIEPAPAGACRTQPLANLVGQGPSESLGAEALRLSGARALRWIRPGDAVTMDYRPDRLNVKLGADHRVEGFSCG